MIISYFRDKFVLVWRLILPEHHSTNEEVTYGVPSCRLTGHSHFVQDVVLSSDGQFTLSGSWDGELRLWNINTGVTIRNTLGECKFTIQDGDSHTEWVSCVRVSTNTFAPTIVSGSWERTVKVWNLTNCKIRCTLAGHGGYVNTVAVSPNGSLCANGGKDGVTLLWVLAEGKKLYSLDAGCITHALCFSPNRYWLCAATEHNMKIWDLESKSFDALWRI